MHSRSKVGRESLTSSVLVDWGRGRGTGSTGRQGWRQTPAGSWSAAAAAAGKRAPPCWPR